MTQVFDDKGNVIPVTIIKGGPCYITQLKTNESCGYNAIQIGYVEVPSNKKSLTKPMLGHFSKNNLSPFKHLKEYKTKEIESFVLGQELNVESFKVGDYVSVSGLTIGKGNIGNIKRHHFSEGLKTHGSKSHRMQGSIGAGTTPGRVLPGQKMPGRTGGEQQTISGLQIIAIDKKSNLLVIKGCIPGKSGNLVSIKNKN